MYLIWIILLVLVILYGWTVLVGAPYVPSKKRAVREALTKLYHLGDKDLLVDLGSGDGVVLREAERLGARAVGYEINPVLFLISKVLSGKRSKINIHFSSYWDKKLPNETTVVYVFGVGRDMKRLKKWLQKEAKRLDKRIYLISLGFEIDGVNAFKKTNSHYLYIF